MPKFFVTQKQINENEFSCEKNVTNIDYIKGL